MSQLIRTSRGPFRYTLDGNTWVFLSDVEELVPFLDPGPNGLPSPPDSTNYDDYLSAAIHPSQAEAFQQFKNSGRFGAPLRREAAVSAWKHMCGYRDIEDGLAAYKKRLDIANRIAGEALDELLAERTRQELDVSPDPLEG